MLWARILYQGWGIRLQDYTLGDIMTAMQIEMAERQRRRFEWEKRQRG